MMTSKVRLGQRIFLDRLGSGLPGQLLRRLRGAIEDEHFGALVPQAEDGCARGAAGPEYQHFGAAQRHPLLQRPDDAGDIGVEAVELAI